MAKEIKQKIVLEGEKQYNQALRDAQRNLKTLKSELKAETAELGKNATEQQKAEKKAESLRKQIAEQEKVVKTLKTALAEVKEKYGDNADEVAKWEQKLNNARTTLANMKSDLEGVGSGFKTVNTDAAQATVATKSVADALGSISSVGDSVAGAIEGIFTTLIDRAMEAAEALWDMITETAGRANKFTDLGSYYGSNAQEMQMWSNSIEAAGGQFENFLAIVNRLSFGGKEKKITELLGISKENYENDIQYTLAVLDELERRKGTMGQGWYDSTMSELFGAKKSADVSWFLSNAHGHESATGEWIYGWRDNPERFNGDTSGYGMSTEGLGTMNDVYITLESIETKWQALKDKFAEGFGVSTLGLLVNVEGTLDGIADYMNAKDDGEREAALQKIRQNVEQFFMKLGEIIRDCIHIIKDVGLELQESDDPLTAAIGDILVKLAESLEWMVEHADEVKGAFETIFGVWLLAKLAAVAGKLGSILMQIEAIKAFKGMSTATDVAAAGTSAGGSWATAFWAAAKKAVPVLAFFAVLGKNAFTEQGNDDLWDEEGKPTELGQSLGITQTQQEADDEWRNSEEGQNSIWGGKGDRIEAGGVVTRSQYNRLNTLWGNYTGKLRTHESQEELLELARREFEGQEELFNEYIRKMYELRGKGGELPDELPLEWFGVYDNEVTENVDLDEGSGYTAQDREQAVQDWWYAWRNAVNGDDSWEEEASAFQWFQEVFGDDFGSVWDRIIQKLDESENQMDMEDLPEDWWRTTGSWNQSGTPGENGVTSKDLAGLQSLPANVESASERGVKKGISGLKVEIDGQTAGRILAPYVSQQIAREMTV